MSILISPHGSSNLLMRNHPIARGISLPMPTVICLRYPQRTSQTVPGKTKSGPSYRTSPWVAAILQRYPVLSLEASDCLTKSMGWLHSSGKFDLIWGRVKEYSVVLSWERTD